jgi:hypothetical protein
MSRPNYTALVERLRNAGPTPSLLLCRDAADAIEQLQRQVEQARRDAIEEQREAARDARAAVAEARWQERQGEDYGSY